MRIIAVWSLFARWHTCTQGKEGCSALAEKKYKLSDRREARSGDFFRQMRKNTPSLRVHQLRANKLWTPNYTQHENIELATPRRVTQNDRHTEIGIMTIEWSNTTVHDSPLQEIILKKPVLYILWWTEMPPPEKAVYATATRPQGSVPSHTLPTGADEKRRVARRLKFHTRSGR